MGKLANPPVLGTGDRRFESYHLDKIPSQSRIKLGTSSSQRGGVGFGISPFPLGRLGGDMGVRYSWRGTADCKSVAYGLLGSIPFTPTTEW